MRVEGCGCVAHVRMHEQVSGMQEAFWQMDKDKDGHINPLELRQALLRGGVPVPPQAEFQPCSMPLT